MGFRSAANAASKTCNKPTGVVSGDVLIAHVIDENNHTITPPSGWTQIDNSFVGSTLRHASFWKLAGGSEPSSYTWTITSSTYTEILIEAFSGVDNASPINDHSVVSDVGSTSLPVIPSLTTTADNCFLAAGISEWFGKDWSTGTNPAGVGWTLDSGISTSGSLDLGGFHKTAGAAGATGTSAVSYASGVGGNYHSITVVALKPAAAGASVSAAATIALKATDLGKSAAATIALKSLDNSKSAAATIALKATDLNKSAGASIALKALGLSQSAAASIALKALDQTKSASATIALKATNLSASAAATIALSAIGGGSQSAAATIALKATNLSKSAAATIALVAAGLNKSASATIALKAADLSKSAAATISLKAAGLAKSAGATIALKALSVTASAAATICLSTTGAVPFAVTPGLSGASVRADAYRASSLKPDGYTGVSRGPNAYAGVKR